MDIKRELEILRGLPITEQFGNPMEIPCIETSDPERLCKYPAVSVHMITYNHEKTIRQAIEGVMMQKTDFEFELVIGEDCSTDKTREICFEYQKKYPDKIRVLWCDHNLYRNPHPAGGNGVRNTAHCRGKFLAYCEGDDCWIDSLKLQKQIETMLSHPNVVLCFCGAEDHDLESGNVSQWNSDNAWTPGLIGGNDFIREIILGKVANRKVLPSSKFIRTASVLLRREAFDRFQSELPIAKWNLTLGDLTIWVGVAHYGDAYFLPDCVSVYNIASTGACRSSHGAVDRDAELIAMYYVYVLKMTLTLGEEFRLYAGFGLFYILRFLVGRSAEEIRLYFNSCKKTSLGRRVYCNVAISPLRYCALFGALNCIAKKWCFYWFVLMGKLFRGYS